MRNVYLWQTAGSLTGIVNVDMKGCQFLVNLRTWYLHRKHPDGAAEAGLGKGYIAQAVCMCNAGALLGINLKRMNGMWIGHILLNPITV